MKTKLIAVLAIKILSVGFVYGNSVADLDVEIKNAINSSKENVIREEDVDWLRNQLKNQVPKSTDLSFFKNENPSPTAKGKCKNCFHEGVIHIIEEPMVKVFMSFSVPENIWINISKELSKVGGTFVLRGIPGNSFNELASKISKLKKNGVDAQIQIDPMSFREFGVDCVPTFVVANGKKFDKVAGNISLEFAMNYLSEKGELAITQPIKQKLSADE